MGGLSSNEILFDPVIKAAGEVSNCSLGFGISQNSLEIYTLINLGVYKNNGEYKSIRHDVSSSIMELCKNGIMLSIFDGKIFVTKCGIKKYNSIKNREYTNLYNKKIRNPNPITWVVVELSSMGESKLEDGTIEGIIRKSIQLSKEYKIFIPKMVYTNNNNSISLYLLEGYIFIQSGLDEIRYFELEQTPYVNRVLSTRKKDGVRVLGVVDNSVIEDMREKLSCLSINDLKEDDIVTVTDGFYRGIDMSIIEIVGDKAIVRSHGLKSLDVITTIPLNCLSGI